MKKLKSMQGKQLGKIHPLSSLAVSHCFGVECTAQNYRCTFWELKLLFPDPVTFASQQKQWSQKKYQLAISVSSLEPNRRDGDILQGSTSRSMLPSISSQVSSWDPASLSLHPMPIVLPVDLASLLLISGNSKGKVSSWEKQFYRALGTCKRLIN